MLIKPYNIIHSAFIGDIVRYWREWRYILYGCIDEANKTYTHRWNGNKPFIRWLNNCGFWSIIEHQQISTFRYFQIVSPPPSLYLLLSAYTSLAQRCSFFFSITRVAYMCVGEIATSRNWQAKPTNQIYVWYKRKFNDFLLYFGGLAQYRRTRTHAQ